MPLMPQTTLPDYHFLYVAPSLGAEWLFVAARAYFERFRPTVLSDLDFVRFVPPDASVAVTVIARRDMAAELGVALAQRRGDALYDLIAEETLGEAKAALDDRAAAFQPFGVALTADPPATPLAPTPGPILASPAPTRPPAGFVTQTPTPTTPAGTPLPTEPPQQPIVPTPGALVGS